MKFLSKERKKYNARLKCLREARIQRKNKLEMRKKILKKKSKFGKIEKLIIDLKLPVHINILNPKTRKQLRKVTKRFRDYYYRSDVCLRLDFKNTKKMYSDGTLYFLAELETLTLINSHITFRIVPSDEKIVNQVLEQTGILKLLQQKLNFEDDEFDESVKYWNYAS